MELLEKLETLNNHLMAKNYKKVIDGCNQILKKNPNIPYVLNLCGLALQGSKNTLASINYFNNLAPMNDKLYIHNAEGKDDMPAHIKSALTNNQISLSIKNGELFLGTWQGIYLFEHRLKNQKRTIIHHYLGD